MTHDEILAAVEAAALATPGVAELYRARPTLGSAVAAAKNIASRTAVAKVILDDDDVLRIVVGTDGVRPAPETAHAVHVRAMEVASEHGLPITRVDVRVARVG